MADHDKHEEEYRYPEEEYVQSNSEPQMQYEESGSGDDSAERATSGGGSAGGVMERIQPLIKNRIVIAILIVIVLFILFRIFMSHHGSTKKTTASVRPAPAVSQPNNTLASNQLTTQLAQQAASQSATSSQLESEVNSIDNKVSSNTSSINQIQSQLNSLQNSIDGIANNRGNVNDAISQLALEVKKLAADIKKNKVAEKPAPAAPMIPPVTYYLRAVVPGRAWIYGTNKRSASITVGDRVKQYGRVLAINAQEGMVVTSSGKVIEFSSADK